MSRLFSHVAEFEAAGGLLLEGLCTLSPGGLVTSLNPAAERALGWTESELVGKSWHESVHYKSSSGRSSSREEDPAFDRRENGEVCRGLDDLVKKDGTIFPIAYQLASMGSSGSLGSILVFTDLSAAQDAADLAERESARAAAAKELEQVKSRFLRIAAHDLRGPLSVALGYLSLIEEGSLGRPPPQVRQVLPIVIGRLKQMDGLIDEMLTASRIEDSSLQLTPVDLDLGSLIREAVERKAQELPRRKIAIGGVAGEVLVKADRARTASILDNLLDNALKYSAPGTPVSCSVRVRGGSAEVAVEDFGIGISAEDLPHLFTRFGRIQTSFTEGIPGAGLGLFLAREMARAQGGDITATSEEGKGSVFTLRLPLAAPPPEAVS